MGQRFFLKELRVPLRVEPVGTAQVIRVRDIAPFDQITLVQRNPFMAVEYLNTAFGIMDSGLFSDITVRNAIIALVRRKVYIAHLLHLRSFIVLKLIGISR